MINVEYLINPPIIDFFVLGNKFETKNFKKIISLPILAIRSQPKVHAVKGPRQCGTAISRELNRP